MTATAATILSPETRNIVLENDPSDRHCLVCYDVLSFAAKTPCQHDEICGVCHLRIRFLHKDNKCPICKTGNTQLIVDHNRDAETHAKTFQDYPIWGDDLGSDFVYQENVGMFFRREYYDTDIKPLFGYHCTIPNCPYDGKSPEKNIYDTSGAKPKTPPTPLRGLQDHLRVKHRLALCSLCVDHQRDFVARLPRYSPTLLKQHLTKGDGKGSGFEGHPVCEFCRPKRFYDLNYLHQHLNKEHYKCHVCEQQGIPNQFFKNYKSLEKHFDTQHFLCKDVQCLQARFVVFANELDLRHHERQVHGGTSTGSSKIQLEFKIRRPLVSSSTSDEAPSASDFNYDLDGQAFVPENLQQTSGNTANGASTVSSSDVALHPMHVERTARLREQAAEWREANSSGGVEAFPTLSAASDANGVDTNAPLRVGWASGATLKRVGRSAEVGAVTEEAFPALRPGNRSQVSSSAATAKLKANNRHSTTARQSVPAAASWGAHRVSGAPQPTTSSFVTPSIGTLATRNQQQNLTADNFPSLGGGSSSESHPRPYAVATSFARQQRQQHQAARKKSPSLNSLSDFPPPLSVVSKESARCNLLGDGSRGVTASQESNILQGPSSSMSAEVTVDDMKATLGMKYKELKRLTKEFAGGGLCGQAYVDMAARLFDQGHTDPHFWKFLPALLASCPNEEESHRALAYMESLKRTQNTSSVRVGPSDGKKNVWGSGSTAQRVKATSMLPALSVAPAAAASSTAASKQATSNKNGKKKKGKQKNELRDLAFRK